MIDTVHFRLRQDEAGRVDMLSETSCYFNVTGEHNFNGEIVLSGNIGRLKITASRHQIKIKDGSLCKWFLGDNFQTMGRGDIQRAIEKLSDTLHLPIDKATVTRLDIAQNFIMNYNTDTYMNHLGLLKNTTRLQEPNGLYYSRKDSRLCFYDKVREQKNIRELVPELYKNRNVLRYEQRYTKKIGTQLNVPEVTGALLYDEAFYIKLLNRWQNTYYAIEKINDITLNFEAMETKQKLYKMGILSLIEKAGGQLEMINQINEAQKKGILKRKQAYDLRQAVNNACKISEGITIPNEAIKELDKKVKETIRFYR